MGRGSRTDAAQHAPALRSNAVSRPAADVLRLRAAASRACDAIFSSHPDPEAHLAELDTRSSQTVAGRGGRLMIALNDLIETERLAYSDNPAEQALGRATFDNAIWHAGRLAGEHDTDGRLRAGLAAVVDEHVAAGAPAVIDDLCRRGLLDDAQATDLRANAAGLAREAYLTGSGKPRWAAVRAMHRAASTLDKLNALDLPEGGRLDAVRAKAAADCDKQIVKGQQFLAGKDSLAYQLTKDSASTITRAEAIAVSLADPATRKINDTLSGSFMDAHDELVAEVAKPRDVPVVAISDARWLEQVMNYQAQISRQTTDVDAVHSGDFGILLAPHTAQTCEQDARAGRANDAVLHEKLHASQPRTAKGRVINTDHHLLEHQLLEGVTQAKANELAGSLNAHPRHGLQAPVAPSQAYRPWVAVTDAAARLTANPSQFLTELSATPKNSRTALLARTFVGNDSADAQLQIVNALLPITTAAEQRYDAPGIDQWAGQQAQRALAALPGAAAAAA